MSRPFLLFCFIFLFTAQQSWGQCSCEENKKYKKLIDAGKESKQDLRKRIDALNAAAELDENCPEAYFELGKIYFRRAKQSAKLSYSAADEPLRKAHELCPEWSADLLYNRALITFSMGDMDASAEMAKAFLDFPADAGERPTRSMDRKTREMEELLDEIDFQVEVFGNVVPFDPVKVAGVSANSDEYLPMLSPDNERIFYTRKYEKKAKGDLYSRQIEEFTLSKRPSWEAPFDSGEALPSPFNLGDNYGGASLSVNNKEMFVTACRKSSNGYNNCDIYVTRWEEKLNERTGSRELTWSDLENLGAAVNTKDGWEAQPSLSADGNTLYFATARESSTANAEGGKSMDIYFSKRGSDGNWGKARSIGELINGGGNEKSPFMHGDSRTLYFSSDGIRGVGGYDIFYSKLQDDGTWTKPKNIGVPINTTDDEHGLIVSTDGNSAYYASNRVEGARGYDIFRFDVPEAAKPETVLLVRGAVTDEDGEPDTSARITLHYADRDELTEVQVDANDGTYATLVNVEQAPVVMTVEKEDGAFQAHLLDEEVAEESTITNLDMRTETMKVGTPYQIDDIYYASNSADIDERSKAVLDVFSDYLQEHTELKIAIHGHTDNVGSKSDNLALSSDRAFEVMTYLQSKGVKAYALEFKGFGPDRPIADNGTVAGRAKNRRTEFVITSR